MLAYFILLLTMVSCQSVYSKVTAPPTSFPLASEGLVQIDGTLQGSNCAKDPIFIQGPLSAKGTALYSGLVYLKGGNSDQIVLALSTDGLNFDTPIELDGVESEWRSVAAIIFEGVVHVAWDSSNPPGNIMYSQFDGVSGTPMFTPYLIPGIHDAKYAVAFAITRKPSPALSVFWSATSESKSFISFVTYDSTTSSWSSASHINTNDWSIATIALAATPNFTVLAWTGESENFYAVQTYDTWTGFTNWAGTALYPNTDYNRPALVAWPVANNQDANFLIFTGLNGNLYYQYHKADGSWDGNAYGQITSNGSPVPATSAPTAGLIGAGPKPRLFIYYCQRVLPTIYRMAYGIVAPN